MQDRFVNGFLSGIIAFLITTPISFILVHYELVSRSFADFAAILSLQRFPETLAEILFGILVEAMTSAVWAVIFAYIVLFIGSKHLWFKGFVYAGSFWYIYVLMIFFLKEVEFNVQTGLLNGLLAGFWGIVMAIAFGWLQTRIKKA
ncbi:hypothetical protein [Natronospora cellulosivora (SeqCode)]